MLTEEIKNKIKEHAHKDLPYEACGIVLINNSVIPCENKAPNKSSNFLIDEVLDPEEISAVYHSHPNFSNIFSYNEKELSNFYKIKLILYNFKEFYEYEPD